MKRMTETAKWDDKWFRALPAEQKILWVYLCDVCDNAGFWEIDYPIAAIRTGMDESTLKAALMALGSPLVVRGDVVWLRNFLRHQKNLPLNPSNRAHRQIIQLLKTRAVVFPEVGEIITISEGASVPLGRGTGKGNSLGRSSEKKESTRERKTISSEDVEAVYAAYPARCPVGGRALGKCSKNKQKIRALLKSEHTADRLIKIQNDYIEDCKRTKTYAKAYATFLNNVPDPEQFTAPVSVESGEWHLHG